MKQSTSSKIILVLLALVVLATIGFLIYSHHAVKGIAQQVPVSENVPAPTPAEWPSTKVSDQTVTDNGSYYTISAVYPIVKDSDITTYFKTFIDSSVAEFKSDTSWAASSSANAANEVGSLSLNITYTEDKTDNADNYIFSTTSYSGGAHGLESTKTFSFSATGQLVTLDTLFTNGDSGLATIAPYVKAQLMASLAAGDQSFLDDGTAPTDDNYANFTIQNNGITFIFDPYEVPYSVFRSIANVQIFPATTQ
jgi:hypothetical protein